MRYYMYFEKTSSVANFLLSFYTPLPPHTQDLLSQDGYPSTHLTIAEKQHFKSTMLRWAAIGCLGVQ